MPHTQQDEASCSALHRLHGYSRWGEPCSCTRWRTEIGAEAQSNAEDINLGFPSPWADCVDPKCAGGRSRGWSEGQQKVLEGFSWNSLQVLELDLISVVLWGGT